jgi:hypothetical protein
MEGIDTGVDSKTLAEERFQIFVYTVALSGEGSQGVPLIEINVALDLPKG